MARNWMINPKIHCINHLLGAHCECHMVVGILKKKTKIGGYIKNNCIEIKNLIKYHDILADEITRRKFNHKTPINYLPDLSHLLREEVCYEINRQESLDLLLSRCNLCKKNYDNLKYELDYIFV